MRFQAKLLLACTLAITAGIAAEITLLRRPPPALERPLKEQPQFTERHLAAVMAKRAPKMDPALRDRLSEAVMAESARAGYDPLFVLAMVGVESGFRVKAESARGARGLVQLKPSTFAWISAREPDAGGADLMTGEDPVVDIRLAVRYFRWLENKFKSRSAALYAYNAGPRRVARHLKAGSVPEKLKEYAKLVRREHEKLSKIADMVMPLPELPKPVVVAAPVLLADAADPKK